MVPGHRFAGSVSQINALVDSMIASLLASGSISWLYYSDRLMELPVGIVAVTIATVLLAEPVAPQFAGDMAAFDRHHRLGRADVSVVRGAGCRGALRICALPLMATRCFFHGAMTAFDVVMASLSLQAFAVGLLGFCLVKVGGARLLCPRGHAHAVPHRRGDGRVEHRAQPRVVPRHGTCRRGVRHDDRGNRAVVSAVARHDSPRICIRPGDVRGVRTRRWWSLPRTMVAVLVLASPSSASLAAPCICTQSGCCGWRGCARWADASTSPCSLLAGFRLEGPALSRLSASPCV